MTLDSTTQQTIDQWLSGPYDAETKATIQELIAKGDQTTLTDSFYKSLEFGTGGMRGVEHIEVEADKEIAGPGQGHARKGQAAEGQEVASLHARVRAEEAPDCRRHAPQGQVTPVMPRRRGAQCASSRTGTAPHEIPPARTA